MALSILILLGMLLQVLLNILLTFIYSSITLPVSTEIGTLELFWSICFKKKELDDLRKK